MIVSLVAYKFHDFVICNRHPYGHLPGFLFAYFLGTVTHMFSTKESSFIRTKTDNLGMVFVETMNCFIDVRKVRDNLLNIIVQIMLA